MHSNDNVRPSLVMIINLPVELPFHGTDIHNEFHDIRIALHQRFQSCRIRNKVLKEKLTELLDRYKDG